MLEFTADHIETPRAGYQVIVTVNPYGGSVVYCSEGMYSYSTREYACYLKHNMATYNGNLNPELQCCDNSLC
jgi:hypothetical protein